MLFPKSKMRLVDTCDGRENNSGYLELNVAAVDIEGAGEITINLDDLEDMRSQRSAESESLKKARRLLGGD